MRILLTLLMVVVIAAVPFCLGGLALQYTIDFWAPFVVHHAVFVPFLPCAIGSLFLGGLPIPLAVGTWLVSFII